MEGFDATVSRGFVRPYGEVFARLEHRRTTTADGLSLAYQVIGHGLETIVLANGLGGRLYSWLGLIDPLQERYKFLSWDYRGLFESEADTSHLSVRAHASDLVALLDAEGAQQAHIIGWSMGVQVGLEVALRHPQRVSSLVLINGSYGQVFGTAFQPFVPLPNRRMLLHELMEQLQRRERLLNWTRAATKGPTEALFWVRKRLIGGKQSRLTLGLRQYFRDVTTTDTRTYLRLFQELDAHCVYHELPDVRAPTTVISGGFDYLTPARQSGIIARRIPGARWIPLTLGSHFVLLERPEAVLRAVKRHLAEARAHGAT